MVRQQPCALGWNVIRHIPPLLFPDPRLGFHLPAHTGPNPSCTSAAFQPHVQLSLCISSYTKHMTKGGNPLKRDPDAGKCWAEPFIHLPSKAHITCTGQKQSPDSFLRGCRLLTVLARYSGRSVIWPSFTAWWGGGEALFAKKTC